MAITPDPTPTRAEVLVLQRAFVRRLLVSGPCCIDDVTAADRLRKKYPGCSGNWRGAAMAGLSGRKLIRRTGELVVTRRPWRHRSRNPVWALTDRAAALAWLRATRPALT